MFTRIYISLWCHLLKTFELIYLLSIPLIVENKLILIEIFIPTIKRIVLKTDSVTVLDETLEMLPTLQESLYRLKRTWHSYILDLSGKSDQKLQNRSIFMCNPVEN